MDLLLNALLLLLSALSGCSASEDILPPGPVDGVLGKNVTLKTLVAKPEYMFIIWNYNDGTDSIHVATISNQGILNVNEPYQGRVSLNGTNGFLTLRGLKSADTGDYGINIVTKEGSTKTGDIKLRVLEPVSDLVIKSNLPEAIEHNSTVVLECSAKGSFLKFKWTNKTTPIVADGKRLTLKEAELSSTLTITGVLRSDLDGPIYCSAENPLEKEKSAPFNLTVHYGPEDVKLSPANPPQYLPSRSNFNLTCSARSSPPATFTWYRNNMPTGDTGAVLTLKAIESRGLGKQMDQYSCQATNAKTKRVVPSAAVSFIVMEPVSGTKITGPTGTLLAGNSSANLTCRATAGTVKSTKWLKDGKALTGDGRVVLAADMSSVAISPLLKGDNGKYTCQLSNPVNTDWAVFNLVVNFGPEATAVKGEEAVEVNDAVKLTCSAQSVPPATYTWKFNGSDTGVKTPTFTIDKAAYKNTGTYTCETFNAVTGKKHSSTHNLSVKEEGALDEGLSDGAIAGIVIGVLVALGAAVALIFYCRQKVPVESPY